MEALSIRPRLRTEKYDRWVNQPTMDCMHRGFSLNLKWWHSNKFIVVPDFTGQVGIFCFMRKKTPASLGANKFHLFELFTEQNKAGGGNESAGGLEGNIVLL